MNGTVKNVVEAKGYGFIRHEGGTEYFFHKEDYLGHWNDLCADKQSGKEVEVEFEGGQTPKGPRARNVMRISETR